jgi:hypothetical protein
VVLVEIHRAGYALVRPPFVGQYLAYNRRKGKLYDKKGRFYLQEFLGEGCDRAYICDLIRSFLGIYRCFRCLWLQQPISFRRFFSFLLRNYFYRF